LGWQWGDLNVVRRSIDARFDIVLFMVDDLRFGVRVSDVDEIVRAVEVRPVPGVPSVVLGVIDVRGRLVPVLDARLRFGGAARDVTPDEHLVLARAGRRPVALRVDRVLDVGAIETADLLPVEDSVRAGGYVTGAARHPDGLILIHDLSTFLSEAESIELEKALS